MLRSRVLCIDFAGAGLAGSLQELFAGDQSLDIRVAQGREGSEPGLPTIAKSWRPELIVLCFLANAAGLAGQIVAATRARFPGTPIMIGTGAATAREWADLVKLDVADFITLPFKMMDVLARWWRLLPPQRRNDSVAHELKERLGLKRLVGESALLLEQIKLIPAMTRCDAHVLIAGETGTGKEMFARAIHFLSARANKPFNAVTCGAIPAELVENELFGHEAGAFTGAGTAAQGLVRATDGGSLFLDEVDSLPLLAQVKLLRLLQEKEFRPLGTHKTFHADVRVIAASNVSLEEAVRLGKFRQDLYFRLNVLALHLPPLRERKEDIPLLARHFLAKYTTTFGVEARELSPAAMQKLMLYQWPGNVRELENTIERAVLFATHAAIQTEDIRLPVSNVGRGESFQSLKSKVVAEFERGYIEDLLRENDGNITKAARLAGKNRRAFWELIRKHGIRVQDRA